MRSAALADQQDRDDHEHRVPTAVETVVAAAASQVNQVRGAAAADVTAGAGAEEPVHVAPAAAISCWTARLNCQCVKSRCVIATHRAY